MTHDLGLVQAVLADLGRHQLAAVIFGGWAEELRGLTPARSHGDIDLLLLSPEEDHLDAFLRPRLEILAKRFSHKRAFVQDKTCVELFLAAQDGAGFVTCSGTGFDCVGQRIFSAMSSAFRSRRPRFWRSTVNLGRQFISVDQMPSGV